MKESYTVRPSQSPWPRVMRRVGQPAGQSVHRGTTGRCMELRKPCPDKGKAIVMSNINGESDVTPTESQTTGTVGYFSHGSREIPATSASPMKVDRSEKARGHKSDMQVVGESDSPVSTAEAGAQRQRSAVGGVGGGRGLTKENVEQLLLDRTQRRASRSRGLLGVRTATRLRRARWSSTSRVRAVCGSAAHTDLCGGRSAMTVPTAIYCSGAT